jgi:hypothetical protein
MTTSAFRGLYEKNEEREGVISMIRKKHFETS